MSSVDDFSLGPFSRDENNDPRRTWIRKQSKGNFESDEDDLDSTSSMSKEFAILNKRLNTIEGKIFGDKVLIEEEQKVAGIGNLGGKITANQNGTIKKTIFTMVCDCCWQPLDGPPAICPLDRRKVHPSCLIRIDQKSMCKECLLKKIPLDKAAYKILLFAIYRIESKRVIKEFTKITNDNINFYVDVLSGIGYLTKGWIRGFQITDIGINIMTVYRQIYGAEEDVIKLEKELREGLGLR